MLPIPTPFHGHGQSRSVKMEHGLGLPLASDDDGDKEYLMELSITELVSNLRTAFRMIDYDRVEEVLVEKENKLKAEIKVLTDRIELERLERMSVQDELRKCKEQCEIRQHAEERYEKLLEEVKKNNGLNDGNMIAELRIRNAELENEKRKADESWKKKIEELSERLLIVEKGANLFMNGETHLGNGGEGEELSELQRIIDPRVSNKVISKKDMSDVDVCDNEHKNITAGAPPSQRKDLKSVNIHPSAVEVTRQSPDSPNKAVLGTSGVSAEEDTDRHDNNEVDRDDHECRNITTDGCGNVHLVVDDDARQFPDTPNTADLGASGTSPSKRGDFGNTCLTDDDDDDDSRQSPNTPNIAMPGASGVFAEDMDGQDNNEVDMDDHECRNIAADDSGNAHLAVADDARRSPYTPNTAELVHQVWI
ncbi:uncharacterized protein LOC114712566 [Neltuma alba]|uniref:uncharacterized protein LOC114712566 n=1 Tax=Neltuma alba TaxID=207710 RepID=UPI0010A52E6E|nr:uncharacterized protein LOC114712566 [Prosopis alba]